MHAIALQTAQFGRHPDLPAAMYRLRCRVFKDRLDWSVSVELAGRANAALNVFHIGCAFVAQYATGLVVDAGAGPLSGNRFSDRVCNQSRGPNRGMALVRDPNASRSETSELG
jgi:hypothetical protein